MASRGPNVARDRRAGFSLIELLTVIAIIAILAAVLFPVATAVRVRAQQAQVISNMKNIQTALGIFKQDERAYPATLGPLVFGRGGNTQTLGGLYPEWLKTREAYHSPALDLPETDVLVQVADDVAVNAGIIAQSIPAGAKDPMRDSGAQMYAWNTMDGHVINGEGEPGTWRYVPHYSRFRTLNTQDPDYKRQLGFRNPPEDTVVTWNDTFVQKNGDVPVRGDYLVLFLSGTVKKYSVKQVADRLSEYNWPQRQEIWRLKPY
ncbi:MAG: prepilin-type N-terminal cleavage/methylation domain-containing protein [Armatimonadetes bacterium]|nr:prepilin-type N-terminal cleavage/methylation domain-containing protein [Armatimonadota bacterium]